MASDYPLRDRANNYSNACASSVLAFKSKESLWCNKTGFEADGGRHTSPFFRYGDNSAFSGGSLSSIRATSPPCCSRYNSTATASTGGLTPSSASNSQFQTDLSTRSVSPAKLVSSPMSWCITSSPPNGGCEYGSLAQHLAERQQARRAEWDSEMLKWKALAESARGEANNIKSALAAGNRDIIARTDTQNKDNTQRSVACNGTSTSDCPERESDKVSRAVSSLQRSKIDQEARLGCLERESIATRRQQSSEQPVGTECAPSQLMELRNCLKDADTNIRQLISRHQTSVDERFSTMARSLTDLENKRAEPPPTSEETTTTFLATGQDLKALSLRMTNVEKEIARIAAGFEQCKIYKQNSNNSANPENLVAEKGQHNGSLSHRLDALESLVMQSTAGFEDLKKRLVEEDKLRQSSTIECIEAMSARCADLELQFLRAEQRMDADGASRTTTDPISDQFSGLLKRVEELERVNSHVVIGDVSTNSMEETLTVLKRRIIALEGNDFKTAIDGLRFRLAAVEHISKVTQSTPGVAPQLDMAEFSSLRDVANETSKELRVAMRDLKNNGQEITKLNARLYGLEGKYQNVDEMAGKIHALETIRETPVQRRSDVAFPSQVQQQVQSQIDILLKFCDDVLEDPSRVNAKRIQQGISDLQAYCDQVWPPIHTLASDSEHAPGTGNLSPDLLRFCTQLDMALKFCNVAVPEPNQDAQAHILDGLLSPDDKVSLRIDNALEMCNGALNDGAVLECAAYGIFNQCLSTGDVQDDRVCDESASREDQCATNPPSELVVEARQHVSSMMARLANPTNPPEAVVVEARQHVSSLIARLADRM